MKISKLTSAIVNFLAISVLGEEDNSLNNEGRLMLSPYIKSGQIDDARTASLVKWGRESLEGIPSYSGFLTVNETTKTNLFMWFVPAMVDDPEDAPVILWINGGGVSSLFGFFVENGPFKVKKRGRIPKLVLRVRKDTWARRHNMLYIDSPVGTGFSYSENENASSPKSQENIIVQNLYSALQQFYQLFPEFNKQELYLAGESCAAQILPRLGLYIHNQNEDMMKSTSLSKTRDSGIVGNPNSTMIMNPLRLKGLILGSPMLDPMSLITSYSSYFYQLGLIDDQALIYMKAQEQLASNLMSEGKYSSAQDVKDMLLFSKSSYLRNITGFQYFANLLETKVSKKRDLYLKFLNQTSTRKIIHVGEHQSFANVSRRSKEPSSSSPSSIKSDLEQLLPNYRVLIYSGQLDLIVPHTGVSSFLKSLKLPQDTAPASPLSNPSSSDRRIIHDLKRGDVSGWLTKPHPQGNLYHILIRNAGHHVGKDQPRWAREIVERFVSNNEGDEDF